MILATSYFGTILHYAILAKEAAYKIEGCEHFIKQSYRSRCEIYGANSRLSLIVPIKKWKNHSLTREVKISYEEDWQTLHWRSIESAYRASPYFEFYEEDLKPLFSLKEDALLKYNQILEREIKEIIGINNIAELTIDYKKTDPDWRTDLHPKNNIIVEKFNFPKYIQVFEEKKGFIPNLSILDLLFNLGPSSKNYLESITQK